MFLLKLTLQIGWLSLEPMSQRIADGKNAFIAYSLLEWSKKIIRHKKLHGQGAKHLRKALPFLKGTPLTISDLTSDMFLKFFQIEKMNSKIAKESLNLLNNVLVLTLSELPLADVRSLLSADEMIAGLSAMCSKKALAKVNFSNKPVIIKLFEEGYHRSYNAAF